MTSIGGAGGPGGIGGAKPPGGVDEAAQVGDVGDTAGVADTTEASPVGLAHTAASRLQPGALDALAHDLATGRLTPHEAIERLVAQAGAGLPQLDQVELRELLDDLVANDPYLGSLAKRL